MKFNISALRITLIICLLPLPIFSSSTSRFSDKQLFVTKQVSKIRHNHHKWNNTENELSALFYTNRDKNDLHLRIAANVSGWPIKKISEIHGDIVLGGLMMVHEREDKLICGKIMPQGGIQALECMLYTIDWINNQKDFLPGIKLGAYILDDCDKDTYGLEQAVDFIK
ncbi:metabotropic glutamate receptor 8-like protein, partial [Dinothrombium tinctorium]